MTNLCGLLWFDNDPQKDWRQKVKDAAARYKTKRWLVPNLCYVSHKDVGVEVGLQEQRFIEVLDGIAVYATLNTQPNNVWITYQPPAKESTAQPTNHSPQLQQVSLL